jgi:hypothetical protein
MARAHRQEKLPGKNRSETPLVLDKLRTFSYVTLPLSNLPRALQPPDPDAPALETGYPLVIDRDTVAFRHAAKKYTWRPWSMCRELTEEEEALLNFSLPHDFWMPAKLSHDWKTMQIPKSATMEAIAQWESLIRETANAVLDYRNSPDFQETGKRMLNDLEHDLELIRQFDPQLFLPSRREQSFIQVSKEDGFGGPTSPIKSPSSPLPPARHSDDFRSVHWYGQDYSFTKTQAPCIEFLWKNWENGTPEVGNFAILQAAKSEQSRLQDVFKQNGKMHTAWGTMIVSCPANKGAFRLQELGKSHLTPQITTLVTTAT